MKLAIALAASLLLAGTAAAQGGDHGSHANHAAAAQAPVEVVGVVRAVDAEARSVTISHEAISALNWDAMTMPFQVADRSLLNGITIGTKVRFQLKDHKIVSLRRM